MRRQPGRRLARGRGRHGGRPGGPRIRGKVARGAGRRAPSLYPQAFWFVFRVW